MKPKSYHLWTTVSLILLAAILGYSAHYYLNRPITLPYAQIALVNLTTVRNEAKAFLEFKEIIERQYREFHEEILAEETRLKQEFDALKTQERQRNSSAQALKNQKDKLEAEVRNLEEAVNNKKQYLNEIFAQATHELETKLDKVIKKIARKKSLHIIFNATILDAPVILYGSSSVDITPSVVSRLNRDFPRISFPESLPKITAS